SIKAPDMVSIDNELLIIKNYVLIHQIRFGDRLHVEYNIEPDCLPYMIPKMILQPIVENAIKHGIEPMKRNGILIIKAYRDSERIQLLIKDNGAGISSEKLAEINASLQSETVADHVDGASGIGLANVHNRIRIIFGTEYGIHLLSEPDHG